MYQKCFLRQLLSCLQIAGWQKIFSVSYPRFDFLFQWTLYDANSIVIFSKNIHMRHIKHNISALCAALCFVTLQAADIKTEKIDTVNLNEIVVLAARQHTQLKKLSGSVSLLSTHQIESLGIQSLTDATSTIATI